MAKDLILVCKKGNAVSDSAMLLIVVFVFVIIIFISNLAFNYVNDDIQSDDSMSNSTKAMVQEHNTGFSDLFDDAFLFVFIALWIVTLVSAYSVDSHPIFFILTVIILIFVFFMGAMIGNVYEEIVADDELSSLVPSYPKANWIMTNLLIVAVVVGFSIVGVLFGKQR